MPAMQMRVPVYNLTVAGTPEYFANGVLVHNCDALRYALHTALGGKTRTRRLDSRTTEELLARRPISQIGGVTIMKRTF